MGLLDSLLKNADALGSLNQVLSQNPQIGQALHSLFSTRDPSVGGHGGLGDILSGLESSGLADVVASWLGGGDNKAIAPADLESALGHDTVSQFAGKAGVSGGEAIALLAGLMPQLVDMLSPQGQLPESSGMESVLAELLQGRRV
ncbi:MAG: YidB family protein [Gammaproteobacteria bacterium]